MNMAVHIADISNPSKSKKLCFEWADRILKEFFKQVTIYNIFLFILQDGTNLLSFQGDEEKKKGLPVSYLCDRLTVNRAKSQVGFIDAIIMPSFVCMEKILPKSIVFLDSLKKNKEHWAKEIDEDEKTLQKVLVSLIY